MKGTLSAVLVVIVILVAAVAVVLLLPAANPNQPTRSLSTSNSVSHSTTCLITGQPAGFYLRVLNDSSGGPVRGAQVAAVSEPAYCDGQQAAPQTTVTFTTNGSEWVGLPSQNDAGYNISVVYSGQTSNFTADLRPVSLTCATVYLPSGRTNMTITEFGETCGSSTTLPQISSVALASVALSGYPGEIAVDANTSRIYVADLFANRLTVVDASSYSVVDTIALPGTAQFGMAIDQERDVIYVPVYGCTNMAGANNSCTGGSTGKGGIVEINGRDDAVVAEFPVDAEHLGVDPGAGVLYGLTGYPFLGTNYNASGSLLAIDAKTGSVLANTSLGADPLGLTVDAKTGTVYVEACKQIPLPCLGAEVVAVDGTSHTVQWTTPLNFDALNFNVVIDQATDTVYTMGLGGSNISLVSMDGTSGRIQYVAGLRGSCAGAGGGILAVNAGSDQIYASFDSQRYLLFIDGSTGNIANMVNVTAGAQYVAFNPSTTAIYVTVEGPHENVGYLISLPGTLSQAYVDAGLLPHGTCLP